jgi:hypothetical protein
MVGALGLTEQVLATNLVVGETWTYLRRKRAASWSIA